MGVPVPPAFAAINENTQENAALIEWFYGPNHFMPDPTSRLSDDSNAGILWRWVSGFFYSLLFGRRIGPAEGAVRYVPGGNYMKRMIPNYDLKKGTQHNFESIFILSNLLETRWRMAKAQESWAKIFLFDALIGNQDRHQDNWGIIWHGIDPKMAKAQLAPAFDNGTSLGHEMLEERLHRFDDPDRLERYVSRGTHHVRWNLKDPNKCNHFELIQKLITLRPSLTETMLACLGFDQSELEGLVMELTKFDIPVALSVDRCDFILKLLSCRQRRLLAILES